MQRGDFDAAGGYGLAAGVGGGVSYATQDNAHHDCDYDYLASGPFSIGGAHNARPGDEDDAEYGVGGGFLVGLYRLTNYGC
jgi:hypothetical protein